MTNGVECLHCNTIIVSEHRHDFKSCACPEERRICVDGGKDYKRRVWGSGARWRDLESSLVFPDSWPVVEVPS